MNLPSKIFNPKNHKTMKEILFDSFLIGAFAGISTLGNGAPTVTEAFIALKAAGLAFFAQAIYEKGIKKKKETKNKN